MSSEAHIIAKAEDLLRRFRQDSVPINVTAIAEGLGIEIRKGDLGAHTSGLIYRDRGATVIGVNDTQSPQRQRFTIAHECGHHELHRDKDLWVDSSVMFRRDENPKDPRELEAHAFAAELLMPRKLMETETISPDFLKLPETIQRLAKKYDVSTPAMTLRLVHLKLLPVS